MWHRRRKCRRLLLGTPPGPQRRLPRSPANLNEQWKERSSSHLSPMSAANAFVTACRPEAFLVSRRNTFVTAYLIENIIASRPRDRVIRSTEDRGLQLSGSRTKSRDLRTKYCP